MTSRFGRDLIDVGLDWIGPIPAPWQVRRLGYFFDERRAKVSDKDFAPLSVTMKGVVPQLENVAKTDDGDNRKLVRAGDFVINSRSDRKGAGGIAPRDGSVSLINTVLATQEGMHPQFAAYLLTSYPFQEEFYRVGNGIVADMWTTKYGEMKNIRLAVPDLFEQQAIVSYLDRATTRMDALVFKKTRFIELLREKRNALITHAVTEGLDARVNLQQNARKAWLKSRLRFVASIRNSNVDKKSYDEQTSVLLCNYTDVYYNEKITSKEGLMEATASTSEIEKFSLQAGDVIITKDSETPDDIGVPAWVPQDLPGVVCGYHLTQLRTKAQVLPEFLFRTMQAATTRQYLEVETPGVTRYGLDQDTIGSIPVLVPPISEQKKITAYLDSATTRIDTLIAKTERSIELLREHRTALITAAVTGKIDLSNAA